MSNDGDHCTDQFKLVADLLKGEGYSTHALGKVIEHLLIDHHPCCSVSTLCPLSEIAR
jgi:hypothetical protein